MYRGRLGGLRGLHAGAGKAPKPRPHLQPPGSFHDGSIRAADPRPQESAGPEAEPSLSPARQPRALVLTKVARAQPARQGQKAADGGDGEMPLTASHQQNQRAHAREKAVCGLLTPPGEAHARHPAPQGGPGLRSQQAWSGSARRWVMLCSGAPGEPRPWEASCRRWVPSSTYYPEGGFYCRLEGGV